MQVLREDAVAIFEALGYKTSRRWSKSRMRTIMEELVAVKEALPGIGDERLAGMLDGMLAAVEGGGEVEFVKGAPPAVEGKGAKLAATSEVKDIAEADESDAVSEGPGRTESNVEVIESTPGVLEIETSPPPPEGKPERKEKKDSRKDKFGNREDTISARFCACLSEEPKSMKELMEESGLKQQYGLVNRLCKEGLVGNYEGKYWAV